MKSTFTLELFTMNKIVPLTFTWPPVLERIIIIGDGISRLYFSTYRASAPMLLLSFGEQVCNIV